MSAKRTRTRDTKVLPRQTLDMVAGLCKAEPHVYLPSPIIAELLRGYERYVAITHKARSSVLVEVPTP